MQKEKLNLYRDLFILTGSIVVAVLIIESGAVHTVLQHSKKSGVIGSFIAGLFFTSVFTTAPAIVVLGEIAQENNPLLVASIGALGSLLGDLILFKLVKDHVSEDFNFIVQKIKQEKYFLFLRGKFFHMKALRWVWPLIGALIIASPLPDELGLAILGLSKTRTKFLIPISYCLNFLGILLIGLVAKSLL